MPLKASGDPKKTCAALIVGFLVLLPGVLLAQADLEYQNRGNRYEGVRPKPVSGYEIELISALVDYRDHADTLPSQLRVRFVLDDRDDVYLIVRELNLKHYYWLDRVAPSQPWRQRAWNEFGWPTDAVLRKLDRNMALHELGVLARLGSGEPSADEHVAPVILYHTNLPRAVPGYLFAFKTSADARLAYAVYKDADTDRLTFEGPLRPRGGRPFVVHWDASRAPAGRYRLVVEGYSLETNRHLQQTVRFFHQPALQ